DTGHLHRHHDAFFEIALSEVERITRERSTELRWADFQTLGQRISHQIILGSGQLRPDMAKQLASMLRWSNVMLRDGGSFSAFYQAIERYLSRKDASPSACLMHESATARVGATRVPPSVGF